MKNKLLPLALVLFGSAAYSQVGIGNLNPNESSQLEVTATDKGVLIPRVSLTSREDVTTIKPGNVNSLLVFNTTNNANIKPGFYYWFENKWEKLSNSSDLEEVVGQDTGSISMIVVGPNLVLTDVHGNSTSIPLSELNLLTTLINNNNGSYTYTSENGTVTNINVTEDVANYFETILNEGPITIGGETYNTFEEYLTHVVKANETITTLVNNDNGTYTYVSENGTVTLIDVKGDVANYFTDILNEGPIIVDGNTYNTFEEYLETIIKSKETVTTLVNNNNGSYTYTSENGTVTNINVTEDVANYFETILNEGPITIGGETYNTFEEYLTHVVKANETITTLVNNDNGTYTYVSEDGTVTLIDVKGDVAKYFKDILNQGPIIVDGNTYPTFEEYLTTIIKSKETVTTLVNNNNGSYTYTSENGTVTNINVTEDVANYFETILNEGPITIDGTTYNTFEEYLTHVVKSNETITTLVNNDNGTYTYVSENGTVTLIDVKGDVANYFTDILNEGPIIVDGNTYNTFEEYLETIIKSKETVTTLVNNNNGSYTYTSENGTVTNINVTEDVANYFETILNEGPITIGGETYNTFEEYLTHVVKANETITTLVNNDNGTYTYVSEDGTVTLIDVKGDVAKYFKDILNQGPIIVDGNTYPTFEEYLTTIIKSKETVTTLVNNNNGSYTYTSENGTVTNINVTEDVANYFETILNEGPITIDGTTYNTFEEYLTHVVKSNETITTLVNNNNGTYTYVSEDGTVTMIDVKGDVAKYFKDILNQGPIIVDGNTYPTFEEYLTSIIKSKETVTTLVNNNNGTYTYTNEKGITTVIDVPGDVANYFETILNEGPITIDGNTYNTFEEYLTHVVKSNETITTLVNNANGTYTYVSEDGTVTVIDVKGDVAKYFKDILNQGPIIVDGNTYPTFEDYLTTIIKSKETVTTLVNNNNGTYTYTSENGTITTINVPGDVANYFNTVLQEGPVTIGGNTYSTFEEYLTHLVQSNETLTSLRYNPNNNRLIYTDENGDVTRINLIDLVGAAQTVTTLVNNNNGTYTYTSENGTITTIDVPGDVANYFNSVLQKGPVTIGGNTYSTFEEYLTHLVQSNETLTSLRYNPNNNRLIYTDENGDVTRINLIDLVGAAQTVTTLVNNNNGTYTYTSENGTITTIDVIEDVKNNFTEIFNNQTNLDQLVTYLTNTKVGGNVKYDGNTFTYVDQSGNSQSVNFQNIVKSNETVTTLVNNNNGTYTYTSENGTITTIDVPGDVANYFNSVLQKGPVTIGGNTYSTFEEYLTHLVQSNETLTSLRYNPNNNRLIYTDENGDVTRINLVDLVGGAETVTTLINNGNGTYTYKNEKGVITIINVVEDVNNNFAEIFNNTTNLNQLVTYLSSTKVGGNVKYDGSNFTFIDQNGVSQSISFESIVKANETKTTLEPTLNGTSVVAGSYTYTNEDGDTFTFNVIEDVNNNFAEIFNNTTNLNQLVTYLSSTKVGGNVKYDGSNFTFIDQNGVSQSISFESIVRANETKTTLEPTLNGTSEVAGSYTYTNEDGDTFTFNVIEDVINNFEEIFNNAQNLDQLVTYLSSTKVGGNVKYDGSNFTFIDQNGALQSISFESIVKANETKTTLEPTLNGTSEVAGSYTYTNEDGDTFTFNVIEDVINNFEEIFNNAQNLDQLVTYLTSTKVGGNVKYDGSNFTFIDQNGVSQSISFESIVKANQSITTLVPSPNGTSFTYTNEVNDPVTINLLAGPTGPAGKSAYEIWLETNPGGSYETFFNSLKGPKGDQGLTGPKGDNGIAGAQGQQGPKGDQGIQGPKGDKGDTGAQGPVGPAGAQGIPGPQGPKGNAGASINIKGELNYISQLPNANNPIYTTQGDGYIIDGDLWIATPKVGVTPIELEFVNVGHIQGPQGPQGQIGPQGIQGSMGPTGPAGQTGATGPKGDKGDKGEVGPQGPQGPQGEQGTGINIVGSLAGSGDLPTTGNSGDAYLIQGDLWVYTGGTPAYQNVGNIRGPQGIQGPQGPAGENGQNGANGLSAFEVWKSIPGNENKTQEQYITSITGPQGPQGIQGLKGEQGAGINIKGSVPNETSLPTIGNEGDAYLINGELYVYTPGATPRPYTNVGNIQGPQGIQGPIGQTGPQGPQGPQGTQGSPGEQGVPGVQGIQGPAGPEVLSYTLTSTVNNLKGEIVTSNPSTFTQNVNIINSNVLSLTDSKLKSAVNGVQSAEIDLEAVILDVTTNSLTSVNNTLTSTINSVSDDALIINSNALSLTDNKLKSAVNGVESAEIDLEVVVQDITTNSLTSANNTLTSTINSVSDDALIINSNALSLTDNKLKSAVNGVESAEIDLEVVVQDITTNSLTSANNTLTSTINSVSDDTLIINSNALSLTDNKLKSTVNGVESTEIDLSSVGIEPWYKSGGLEKATTISEDIFHTGKVVVGATTLPVLSSSDVKVYVQGDLEVSGKLWTSASVYADYVFEKYFTGESEIRGDYSFNKLKDVKEFIKKNHHLPGVTPIGNLKKVNNGYMIDYSNLSIQQLEKIEELYIHTIEQQDLIENQNNEINSLKSQVKETNDRLEKLEKLLLNVQK